MIIIKYAQIRQYDIANGLGIGCTLFVSGCNFHCKGCFNKEYQDFNFGKEWDKETEDKFVEMCKNDHVDHVSLLGGEVLMQDLNLINSLIDRLVYEVNKPIWLWTGFIYEELNKERLEIVHKTDVLVDGQFVEKLKDYRLKYCGSSNQRVIDIKNTIKNHKIVQLDK